MRLSSRRVRGLTATGSPGDIDGTDVKVNALHQFWPAVDEAGIELDQAGSGGDFGGGVCGGHDAADGDEGDLALAMGVQVADDFGRAGGQWGPAQAASADLLDA